MKIQNNKIPWRKEATEATFGEHLIQLRGIYSKERDLQLRGIYSEEGVCHVKR